jgi:hypothetical protein
MTDTPPKQLRPERVDKKGVMTYLPEDMAIQLKVIAAERRETIQRIGEIAFSHWLALYAVNPTAALDIAPRKEGHVLLATSKKQPEDARKQSTKKPSNTFAVIRTDKPLRKPSKITGPSLH